MFWLAVDLKKLKVYNSEPDGIKADTTITVSDEDMVDIVSTFFEI